MDRFNTLSDLLIEELTDLLNAANQLAKALPALAEASLSPTLTIILENHLRMTKGQAHRLQDIFKTIGQNPQEEACKVMKKLIAEGQVVAQKNQKCPAQDAAIISIGQRIEQYEIAKYKMAREHAAELGATKIVELLTTTLNEERAMNFHLNELSQYMINIQAQETQDQEISSALPSRGVPLAPAS